jgi:hypothetical protein
MIREAEQNNLQNQHGQNRVSKSIRKTRRKLEIKGRDVLKIKVRFNRVAEIIVIRIACGY